MLVRFHARVDVYAFACIDACVMCVLVCTRVFACLSLCMSLCLSYVSAGICVCAIPVHQTWSFSKRAMIAEFLCILYKHCH